MARTQARRIASMKVPSRPLTPRIGRCVLTTTKEEKRLNVLERRRKFTTSKTKDVDRILSEDIRDVKDVWNTVLRIYKTCDDEMDLSELVEHFTRRCEKEVGTRKLQYAKCALRLARKSYRSLLATTTLCKSVYSDSKNKNNDEIFRETGMLQELSSILSERLEREEEYEECVIGTLRNLSNSNSIQHWMAMQGGTIDCMTRILKREHVSKTTLNHVLCVLRNLTVSRKHFKQFLSHDTIEIMCDRVLRMDKYQREEECMYHVSRVLAKVSLDQKCRGQIRKCGDKNMNAILRVLKLHPNRRDLVIRMAFVLGNMTASNESDRRFLVPHFKKTLYDLFHKYVHIFMDTLEEEEEKVESNMKDVEEILVKLVRVVANVAIDSRSGTELVSSNVCVMLIDLFCSLALRLAEGIEDDTNTEQQEELCVFLISALTNLSFYADGYVHDSRARICKHLVNIIVLYVHLHDIYEHITTNYI